MEILESNAQADLISRALKKAHAIRQTAPDEAFKICCDVLNRDFDNPFALFLAGHICLEANRKGVAYTFLHRAIELEPNQPSAWSEISRTFGDDRLEDVHKALDIALEIDPNFADAWNNKARAYLHEAQPEKVIRCANKAIQISGNELYRINRGQAHLMQKNWRQGWQDNNIALGVTRKKHDYDLPEWNGEKGKCVLVYGEQGLGDEILFASCIPDLINDSDHVILNVDSRLKNLFSRSFDCEVHGTRKKDVVTFSKQPDFQVALGSLPGFYRNKNADFPGTPYLQANPKLCKKWKKALDCHKGPTIGIAWTGGMAHNGGIFQTIPAHMIKELFELDATFISLEYNDSPQPEGVVYYPDGVKAGVDFDETIALINELDLVVSVCTTAIHACGSMGKECWVMVPNKPTFRYHLTGSKMPWYNSIEMHRQMDVEEDWTGLIGRIKRKLQRYIDGHLRESENSSSQLVKQG